MMLQEEIDFILKHKFKLNEFKANQKEIIQSFLTHNEVLLIMPTGAGKSLCYQLPGLVRKKTTLVISPLISLMQDQTIKLQKLGIKAEALHSNHDRSANAKILENYKQNQLDFLFLAPERIFSPGMLSVLENSNHNGQLVIDEAHCISHWGHDFRPDYLKLGELRHRLNHIPTMAVTASATPSIQCDILKQLKMPQARSYINGFKRENIAIQIQHVGIEKKLYRIRDFIHKPANRPAIIYVQTRQNAVNLSQQLNYSFRSEAYHGGLSAQVRTFNLNQFIENKIEVMVATIAFGMGIDKPNIRSVVHSALPGSIESYYQEIGRAGRDGHLAKAILFYSKEDLQFHHYFIAKKENEAIGVSIQDKQSKNQFTKLNEMLAFVQRSTGCRMHHLIRYFGDQDKSVLPCGICDLCQQT